jgi:hypothetical protein
VIEVPFREAWLAGPAGSINSSIADMTRWVLAQINRGVGDGTKVISPAALKQLHAPTMVLPEDARTELWPEASNLAYALGWFVMNYRGHTVIHHGGNIDGFAAMVSLLPSERIAVVVLTNLHPTGLRDVVPNLVFDELLGLSPLPWGERYHEMYAAMLGGVQAAAAHKKTRAASAPHSHPVQAYAGRYAHPGYGDVVISLENGRLVPHYNDLDLSMEHVHYETWALQLPVPDSAPFDVVFDHDADGSVSAVRIPMEASIDAIVFKRQPHETLADAAVLARYRGAYAMGPLRMSVELEGGDTLIADVAGQGRLALVPKADRCFSVRGAPMLTVEFVLGEDGAVTSVVVDPVGIFVAQS